MYRVGWSVDCLSEAWLLSNGTVVDGGSTFASYTAPVQGLYRASLVAIDNVGHVSKPVMCSSGVTYSNDTVKIVDVQLRNLKCLSPGLGAVGDVIYYIDEHCARYVVASTPDGCAVNVRSNGCLLIVSSLSCGRMRHSLARSQAPSR
jgi:hypothetical protein